MMNVANPTELDPASAPTYRHIVAPLLALLGAGFACTLAPFVNGKPSVAVTLAVFPILMLSLLWLPAYRCLRPGPRILLILVALRPLVDVSSTFQPDSTAFTLKMSSGFSLQQGFGAVFALLLVAVWVGEGRHREFARLPNLLLILLLGLTALSWLIGGVSEGALGFAQTAWGLLVALFLGSLFHTDRQIDVFVRTVFYSSFFVLVILGLNLRSGLFGAESDTFWRLSGQYGTPNALAGVTLSFFLYGLYSLWRARTLYGKVLNLVLLSFLAVVIVLTQSRTVGSLMLTSVCIYLWARRRRWLLYGVTVPLLFFLFASATGTGWRLVSSFSLTNEQINPNVLTLQGRVLLWGEWLTRYLDATLLHKVFGFGWGVVLRNFLSMGFPNSSVTENSFLWFLIGTGALGSLTFLAYLIWVLFKAVGAWRRASSDFQRRFALLAFLVALSFLIEAFTTDLASAPNADVYIFAVMSIFVYQWLRSDIWRRSSASNNGIL